jgi:hypothetical protein
MSWRFAAFFALSTHYCSPFRTSPLSAFRFSGVFLCVVGTLLFDKSNLRFGEAVGISGLRHGRENTMPRTIEVRDRHLYGSGRHAEDDTKKNEPPKSQVLDGPRALPLNLLHGEILIAPPPPP